MRFFIIVVFLFFSFFSKASHVSGGQITYKCLGNNLYEVKLTYFWDCQGGFNPGTSQTINVDGCGNTLSLVVNQSTLTPGDGIQADGLCANSGVTTCKKRIEYIGTITLPSVCNQWTFSIGSCCRGGNITNIASGTSASYYHYATLNNTAIACNNSPDISIGTLPNFCVNQSACFNLGATELDGNTLSYAFIDAYQTATTFVTYNTGFSGTSPIAGITIDPNTGQISLTPTLIGDFVITVQITEKDAAGNIIGTIMRDFQVIVTNCNNQTVACGQGGISNVTSGTIPVGGANTLQICENVPFCFDVFFSDPDTNDSLYISSPNVASSLPGSSMVTTYTPGVKNKVKATICWTPPTGSSGLNTNFVVLVKDNSCPVPGTQVLNYFIDVLPATSAGPDQTICGSQAASVTATGSSTVFAWSDLAGNPIPIGSAFSCNPCKNPVIKPAVTSTYVVTNVGGGANCKNKDTLIVKVVPDFTLSAGVNASNSCLNSLVQFTSSINPPGVGYSYSWSPSVSLTTTNTANTSATFSVPGSYNYTLTAVNSFGCTKQSNNVPFVAQPVTMPIFTVVPTNTVVCANSNIPLSVNIGTFAPTVCGLATSGCVSTNTFQIGSGTTQNSNTSYPCVFGNYWKNNRHQILFTAAELSAAGVVPGKLNSLAFQVISMLSSITPTASSSSNYSNVPFNYTIKIKCTNATALTSTFDNSGLVQVFNGNYSAVVGWNTFNFNQAYEWPGSTNILVDICYNLQSFYTSNPVMNSTATTPVMCVYATSDTSPMCGTTNAATTSNNRPNVRFGNCSSVPPASTFSYSWFPVTGLSNPNISNPIANLSSSILYSVVVTPTAAPTCSNVGTTSLTLVSPVIPTITPVSAKCSNAPTFALSATPAGGTWSLTAATSTLGTFSPSLAAIGNNTISYTYGGVGCLQTTTSIVPIEQYVPSTITGTIAALCVSNPTINLATTVTTSTLGVGVWSGNGVLGSVFNPSIAGAGVQTLTYSTQSNVTATLCPSSSTISITVNSVVQPTISASGPYCDNFSPQQLSANPIGGVWSSAIIGSSVTSTGQFAPSSSLIGNNKLYYTISNAPCIKKDSVLVNVVKFIPATIAGTVGPYCIYDPTVSLQSVSQNSGGTWSGSGVAGSSFSPILAGSGTTVLSYSTDPIPNGLCPDAATLSVLVNPKPEANVVLSNLGGCNYPWTVNFSSSTVNTGIASWDFGDGSPLANGLFVSHEYNTPGSYTTVVIYTDNTGCVDTTTALSAVTIYSVPIADFEPSLDVTTLIDAQIEFTNHTTNGLNNTYNWSFGDSATSVEVNPTYLYTNSGEYNVTLIAVSSDGCRDSITKKIIINPDVVLYVPNAFTPGNNDGLNDVFQIYSPPTGIDFNTFSLLIYDRWGELVYKTNDITMPWTGAKNNAGVVLPQGVYVWKINFQDIKKKHYERMGHVSLLHK